MIRDKDEVRVLAIPPDVSSMGNWNDVKIFSAADGVEAMEKCTPKRRM